MNLNKTILRKPNLGEIYMYTNLFWLAVLVYVFIPIFNNFVLQLIILYTDGNIAYGSFSETVSVVRDVLAAAASYVGLGIFAVCLINFGKNAFGVTVMAFVTHGVSLCTSLFTYSIYGGEDALVAFFLLGTDMLVNIFVYAIIYLVLMYIVKKRSTVLNVPTYKLRVLSLKHPLSFAFFIVALIYGLANILATLYQMIGDFLDPSLGPPVSLADTLYWVTEYLSDIVLVCVGYFIMLAVGSVAEKWKKFNKSRA